MTHRPHFRAWLAALGLALAAGPAQAAVDMFLKIGDIEGESKDLAYPKQIVIDSWSWGLDKPAPLPGGGGGVASKASFQDLSLTKFTDSATAALMDASAKGTVIPKATLYIRKAGLKPVQFYRVVCEEVLVTSVQAGGQVGEDRFRENITLNCARIGVEYVVIDRSGQPILPGKRFDFNIPENVTGGIQWDQTPGGGGGDPGAADTDRDGLPDAWETQYGTNPNVKDADGDLDGDGATNFEEYLAGTDPSKRDSVFVARLTPLTGGGTATLTWNSVAGLGYKIFISDTVEGTFREYLTVPSSGNGTTSAMVPADIARKFFRVQAIPAQ